MARHELLIYNSLRAHRSSSGNLVLPKKFLDGLTAYAERWEGDVTAIVNVQEGPDSNLDHQEFLKERYTFHIEEKPTDYSDFIERIRKADLIVSNMKRIKGVRQASVKEYGIRTRLQIVNNNSRGVVRTMKRLVFALIRHYCEKVAAIHHKGIQCNGIPAYKEYRCWNNNVFLFFDSRILQSDLIKKPEQEARKSRLLAGRPLHLVFTGRLIKIKGVEHLPVIADELLKLGVDFTLSICGGGDCEEVLINAITDKGLQEHVHLHGVLKYREELLPFMKDDVDLFICPHFQGDPSCTYLETMACGVPIIGYANEAWLGMEAISHGGWVTPMKNPKKLAEKIAEVDKNRELIIEAGVNALNFADRHTFEETIDRRVEHFYLCLD